MPKFKKDRSKFIMKGFSPFTSNELTEKEKIEIWRQIEEEKRKKEKEEKNRLSIHKPKGGAY